MVIDVLGSRLSMGHPAFVFSVPNGNVDVTRTSRSSMDSVASINQHIGQVLITPVKQSNDSGSKGIKASNPELNFKASEDDLPPNLAFLSPDEVIKSPQISYHWIYLTYSAHKTMPLNPLSYHIKKPVHPHTVLLLNSTLFPRHLAPKS